MPGTALVPEDAETRAPTPPLMPQGLVGRCTCERIIASGRGSVGSRTKQQRALLGMAATCSQSQWLSHEISKDE